VEHAGGFAGHDAAAPSFKALFVALLQSLYGRAFTLKTTWAFHRATTTNNTIKVPRQQFACAGAAGTQTQRRRRVGNTGLNSAAELFLTVACTPTLPSWTATTARRVLFPQ